MHRPLLSVVVPCFNAEKTLKKTLLSVAMEMRDYPECEVIVVNDGSTDKTSRIVIDFEKWDRRFKGVTQENRGVSAARNKGVTLANGDYIAFLDADDLLLRRSISERMRVFIEDDDPDMLGVFCPAALIDMDGNVLQYARQFDYHLPCDRLYFSAMPESVFNPSCVIVKKSEFLRVGGFDETITPAEDYDLWHKMMRRGGYFRKQGSCSIGWRQHSMSACHSNILKHYRQCKLVTNRVFSESTSVDAEEYQGGYGRSLYYLTITARAFGTAILAVVSGQYEDAAEISTDINKRIINQISPERLEEIIKSSALRALSKPDDDWNDLVWPEVRKDVLSYIADLNQKLGGNCITLLALNKRLDRTDTSTFDLTRSHV